MADTKISALTALTGANVAQTSDVLAIVDTSVTTTKKILISELALALNVNGTAQATTSGTSWDFTIPAWATNIIVMVNAFSTNGTSIPIIQIGDSGGIETSGYLGTVTNLSTGGISAANHNTGFAFNVAHTGTGVYTGRIHLSLLNASTFNWSCSGALGRTDVATTMQLLAGNKLLSAALTTVRLTTVNGTDAGDAGSVNVLYS